MVYVVLTQNKYTAPMFIITNICHPAQWCGSFLGFGQQTRSIAERNKLLQALVTHQFISVFMGFVNNKNILVLLITFLLVSFNIYFVWHTHLRTELSSIEFPFTAGRINRSHGSGALDFGTWTFPLSHYYLTAVLSLTDSAPCSSWLFSQPWWLLPQPSILCLLKGCFMVEDHAVQSPGLLLFID